MIVCFQHISHTLNTFKEIIHPAIDKVDHARLSLSILIKEAPEVIDQTITYTRNKQYMKQKGLNNFNENHWYNITGQHN